MNKRILEVLLFTLIFVGVGTAFTIGITPYPKDTIIDQETFDSLDFDNAKLELDFNKIEFDKDISYALFYFDYNILIEASADTYIVTQTLMSVKYKIKDWTQCIGTNSKTECVATVEKEVIEKIGVIKNNLITELKSMQSQATPVLPFNAKDFDFTNIE